MPLTFAEIAPLMRGHYVDEITMWSALKPRTGLILDCARRLARDTDHKSFAVHVLADLALAIQRRKGLAFEGAPPRSGDYTGWLLTNVRRVALDALRHLRPDPRHAAADDLPSAQAEGDASDSTEAADRPRTTDVWEKLRASDCPPAYRLALFAWYWPRQLARDDLVALSQQVERGKSDQRSGLIRPVEQTWPALLGLWRYFPSGVRGSGAAQVRFAWIIRSDSNHFRTWASDSKVVRAARETIGKWHLRGRRWLERHATAEGGGV